eukprot:824577-Rhodomonas_salina.1
MAEQKEYREEMERRKRVGMACDNRMEERKGRGEGEEESGERHTLRQGLERSADVTAESEAQEAQRERRRRIGDQDGVCCGSHYGPAGAQVIVSETSPDHMDVAHHTLPEQSVSPSASQVLMCHSNSGWQPQSESQ